MARFSLAIAEIILEIIPSGPAAFPDGSCLAAFINSLVVMSAMGGGDRGFGEDPPKL